MASETVQIATVGEYLGHPQGEYELTLNDLQQVVNNFADQLDVVIDYDHASLNPRVEFARAAGWINKMWVDGGTLYANVSWTTAAEEAIDSDEGRYLSPVWDFSAQHPNSGQPIGVVLDSVGLTNRPFYQNQPSVREEGEMQNGGHCTRQYIQNAMGLRINGTELGTFIQRLREEKDMTQEELGQEVGITGGTIGEIESGGIDPPRDRLERLATALDTSLSELMDRLPDDVKRTRENSTPRAMDWQERWTNFVNRLGKIFNTADADELSVLDEARQLQQKAERVDELEEENKQLNSRVSELEEKLEDQEEQAEQAEQEADEELLDEAVANFKIAKSDRDDWEERLQNNRDAARLALNSIPEGAVQPGTDGPDEPTNDTTPSVSTSGDKVLNYVQSQTQ